MIIYKITNEITNKIYICFDSKNINTYLGSGLLIRRSVKKYGKDNFSKIILENVNLDNWQDRERYWISYLDSTNREIGYNITSGGYGGDVITNHPNRLDIVKKMSVSGKGTPMTKQCLDAATKKRKLYHPGYGTEISDKVKARYSKSMSEKLKNIWKNRESHQKGKSFIEQYGEHRANEMKQKMSDKLKGEMHPNFGTHRSEHTKKLLKVAGLKAKNPYKIKITSDDGIEHIVDYMAEAEDYVKGSRGYIKACLINKRNEYKGFKFNYIK